MDVERKIFSNTAFLAAGQVVAQIANFGFVVLFARSFGAPTLGMYSLAMAIGGLACSFVSFGTNSLSLKEISRDPRTDREIIGRILPLQIVSGTTIWLSLSVAALYFSANRTAAQIIVVVAAFHVVQTWQTLLLTRFQSRQLMRYVATMVSLTRVGILILGGVAIYAFQDAAIAVVSLPASALLVMFVVYASGKRQFGRPTFVLDTAAVADVVRKAWPFMSIVVLGVLYGRLGVIFLRVFHSDDAVGYFASAERLLVPFTAVFAVYSAAVFPALARVAPELRLEREALARRCLRVLLALILPAATLVYLYRADIVHLLYGEGFQHASTVLTVLAWVIALRGFNAFLSMYSVSADLQKHLSKLKLLALLVFISLCALLIPAYSYLGLAYATIVSDLFLAFVMQWSLRRKDLLGGLASMLWRPSLCCLITVIVTMNLLSVAPGFRLALSVATFVTAAFLTGAIKRHDVSFLLRIAKGGQAPETS